MGNRLTLFYSLSLVSLSLSFTTLSSIYSSGKEVNNSHCNNSHYHYYVLKRLDAKKESSNENCSPSKDTGFNDLEIMRIEKEMISNIQARMDMETVFQKSLVQKSDIDVPWKVSAAAATISTIGVYSFLHDITISCAAFVCVFIAANFRPLEEEGVVGPIARILGRSTINTVSYAEPKLKAITKAALTSSDEIDRLKLRIRILEKENQELRLWKEQRRLLDSLLPNYSLEEIKTMARENNIMVRGTKSEVLLRLIQNDVFKLS